MSYTKEKFVKVLNGVKAPAGFHYMPNGKLMNDADHIAQFGYAQKKITNIDIDTKDIDNLGETKNFSIKSEKGAIVTIFVQDNSGNFYNFTSKTFTLTKDALSKIEITSGNYLFDITFPAVGGSLKTYTFNIIAETAGNIKTVHAEYIEVRNVDNSININQSTGSRNNLVQKIINQDTAKTFTLSCVAPTQYVASSLTVDGAVSSSNRVVVDQDITSEKFLQVHDLVTGTGVDTHQLVTAINPDGDNVNEFQLTFADSISDGVTLTATPPFNGVTPHYNVSTSGAFSDATVSTGGSLTANFSITITATTGRTLTLISTPTTDDLCAITTVNFGSAALAIEGENTSSSSVFFRFPVTNIANLSTGLLLDSARAGGAATGGGSGGTNTTNGSRIANYRTTKDLQEIFEREYYNDFITSKVDDVYVAGVDPVNNDVTTVDRNGRITAQAGNIVFNKQQADALKSDTAVRLFAHGAGSINSLTGMDIKISDVTATLTQISTTTSSGVSNSTTIPVAEAGNISVGMTMRGIGVSASAANPTVVSKNVTSGAGNVVVSAAQTIENGQTLFFDGGSNIITLAGTVQMSNMPISDTTIFFDLERFLLAR